MAPCCFKDPSKVKPNDELNFTNGTKLNIVGRCTKPPGVLGRVTKLGSLVHTLPIETPEGVVEVIPAVGDLVLVMDSSDVVCIDSQRLDHRRRCGFTWIH